MVPAASPVEDLHVGAAALSLVARGLGPAPRAALARRYAGFGALPGSRGLRIEFKLLEPRGGPIAPGLTPRFAGGRLELDHPRYRGWIDAAAGRAELWIEAQRPVEEVDYGLRLACALLAWECGGLMLHAAGLAGASGGRAFFGPSGSGKSTLTRQAAGRRVLGDDLVLLLPSDGGWTLHASPFCNPALLGAIGPGQAPLVGLYCLKHARRVKLEPLSRAEALAELVASVPVVNADPGRAAALLSRLDGLIDHTAVQRLHLRPAPDFWSVIEAAQPSD